MGHRAKVIVEPCGAAELLEVGNAAAVIVSQRPEHHEHAGEAAVPVEGLLHVRNLISAAPNLSTTVTQQRGSNNWKRRRKEQEEADIDVVGSARERNLAVGGRRVRAVAAVVAGNLEQLVGDDAEGPHDMVKPAEPRPRAR